MNRNHQINSRPTAVSRLFRLVARLACRVGAHRWNVHTRIHADDGSAGFVRVCPRPDCLRVERQDRRGRWEEARAGAGTDGTGDEGEPGGVRERRRING